MCGEMEKIKGDCVMEKPIKNISLNDEFLGVVKEAQEELLKKQHYKEWKELYEKYANGIIKNLEKIKKIKAKFHQWKPLYLYMSIGESYKSGATFNLRYLGQAVADLKISSGKIYLKDDKTKATNYRDFGCNVQIGSENREWRKAKAINFRKHFSTCPQRSKNSNKSNEEHRIESMLLTEFSKHRAKDKNKVFHYIKPVKIAKIARFQMPTPFSASKKSVKYVGGRGGGIDIIARVGRGRGNGTKFCIMEVKDQYLKKEPPKSAIKQALVYATFIRELLRCDNGDKWWEILGREGRVPQKIVLCVACAMPFPDNNRITDKSFGGMQLNIGEDIFELHYVYFKEENNLIKEIETSLWENK